MTRLSGIMGLGNRAARYEGLCWGDDASSPTPGIRGESDICPSLFWGCNNHTTEELSLCSLWVEASAHLARGLAKNPFLQSATEALETHENVP